MFIFESTLIQKGMDHMKSTRTIGSLEVVFSEDSRRSCTQLTLILLVQST